MFDKKWYSFKPISYVGFILAIIGIIGHRFFETKIVLIEIGWVVVIIVGLYLIIRGREKHGNKKIILM